VDAKIPFNRISQAGGEMAFVAEAIANAHASGNGPFTHRCEAVLELATDVRRVLLTTSCTHALEMSGLLLDVGSGDEVIVPSFTFVSTVNAFVLRGAKPVFVDVRPDTLNMDERLLEGLITSRTRVIVPVHYAGVGCEMDSILAVAGRRSIAVVEDNAHGLFGKYKGKPLGSFGCLATQSFHETKNISCGEGGALVINDSRYVERAEIIREKGTDRSKFFRGQVDKYTWVDIGSSYVMSDLLAAFLYAQLEKRDTIQARRRAVWERYHEGLADWAAAHGVRTPVVPAHCEQAYHMYYLVMPDSRDRDALLAHLKKQGVHAVFHYLPLHTSPMGRRFGGREGQCPVTEEVSQRLIRLPFYAGLAVDDQERVVDKVRCFPF
jgi:dTDP-4-amino-4,6-dideoxygalactose transaminase